MTWEEYYEKFYDWATSTQINRLSKLTSYGSADEICEGAIALGVVSVVDKLTEKHGGRCNGDFAHCPPHYGYRYGRCFFKMQHP